MDDEIERMAEAIHKEHPVTFEGKALDWEHVSRSHPDRAFEYREAARKRIRAEEAMNRLDEPKPDLPR
ncbi:hypothetical protein P7D22_13305 [Lichenihabitans sp. Uapishka_5]|uniref:hypothetical protein n=1 Tax=Lichenihabitans sp. Uapishka_5 TaxID=3037302 RepID=UPI0029E7DFE4|nr:hypothetical protein [Lichenihabitans sp. Uapishka_5]MDX7952152.1 hypothetical protein [Lichenihabitans sp. Uapishka_5]